MIDGQQPFPADDSSALAALAARWRAKAAAEAIDSAGAHTLLDCAEDLEAAAGLRRYTHLAGVPRHTGPDAERFPGGLSTATPADVTCPVCLGHDPAAPTQPLPAQPLPAQPPGHALGNPG